MPGLLPFRPRTLQLATYVDTRRALFPSALGRARLLESYPLVACTLNDGCLSSKGLSATAFSRSLIRRGLRRKPKLEGCRSGRQTPFQTTRVCWEYRRRTFVLLFGRCPHLPLSEEVSRHCPSERLSAVSGVRGQCPLLSEASCENRLMALKTWLSQTARKSLPVAPELARTFKSRLAGLEGPFVDFYQVIQEGGGIGIEDTRTEQRGCSFLIRASLCIDQGSFVERKSILSF